MYTDVYVSGQGQSKIGSMAILDSLVRTGSFNSNLGFVFQNPDDQIFCPTVRDDLSFGLLNLGYSKGEADSMIDAYLTRLEMSDLAGRPPHNLSGGEKRMISIAGVIIMNPTVVLLDEPESSLDSRARRQLIEFIRKSFSGGNNITILENIEISLNVLSIHICSIR
jgi:cobalt/nickel transport system ATP-binding protein